MTEPYEDLTPNVTYNVPPYKKYKDKVSVKNLQIQDSLSTASRCVIGFSCLLSSLALGFGIAAVVVSAVHTNTVADLHRIGSLASNPASSCNEITEDRPSGFYWIQPNNNVIPVQVYCDMDPRNCSCSSTGGWMRVANIDMTNPAQTCPDEFRLITTPRRACSRPADLQGCQSTTFPVHGIEYSRVCGRIIGYQVGAPDGFYGFVQASQTIDGFYIAGISLTHGSPRQHIWSFVNALSEDFEYNERVCPCSRNDNSTYTGTVPPFIGEDYFCDTGIETDTNSEGILHSNDPLWDGAGCSSNSTCCEFNNPPWFCKQLPQSTTNNIELRICENSVPTIDESPFEVVEIFIN